VEALSAVPSSLSWLRLSRGDAIRAAIIAALVLFTLLALPSMLSLFWVDTATSTVIYAIVALGLANTPLEQAIGLVAVIMGAMNVTGGYVVTERILAMFDRSKPKGGAK